MAALLWVSLKKIVLDTNTSHVLYCTLVGTVHKCAASSVLSMNRICFNDRSIVCKDTSPIFIINWVSVESTYFKFVLTLKQLVRHTKQKRGAMPNCQIDLQMTKPIPPKSKTISFAHACMHRRLKKYTVFSKRLVTSQVALSRTNNLTTYCRLACIDPV